MRVDIAFLSLAKNCAGTLPAFLEMLSTLRSSGVYCIAYIGENGSGDGTNVLLREAEQRGELTLIPTNFLTEVPDRLQRMALGRQHLKDVLDNSGLNAQFICVADVDDVMKQPPPINTIRKAMMKLERSNVFAVSATSRPRYYDLLAYEDDSISFEFLQEEINAQKRNPFSYYRFFAMNVDPYRRRLTSEHELLCTSAFNGLCIYKTEAYALGSYLDSDFRRCEHLTFNRKVAKATGARILIDPDLVLSTPSDHAEKKFMPFVWSRIKKLLRNRSLVAPSA
jgi:hypothetical protein